MSEKKKQVINAARELFSTYGYKKVSIDEIAKKAGVTKKTIYSYFKDKNDLFKFFIYEELENMHKITEEIEEENLPYTEKIHKIICALFEYKKNSKLLSVISRESENINTTSVGECFNIINNSIRKTIKEKLDIAIINGNIKECDTELLSYIVYKFYFSVMFEWDSEKIPVDRNKVAKALISILKNGIFREDGKHDKKE